MSNTMVYRWKAGAHVPAGLKAQSVGERLESLRVENGGTLTPRAVVDDARSENSALHPAFEWNDAKAADAYRIEQARYLVSHVAVVYGEPEQPKVIRAFVNLKSGEDQAYTSTVAAMSDDVLRAQVLKKAWDELQSWRKRYDELREFSALFAQMDALSPQLQLA